jgi:AraC family transcriptional regulator of adaptative response / DNA-3-methyladenine glycosylase II
VAHALDPDACYSALAARDARFDGRFFVGVTTTGIYCRPICTARTPARARCVFFRRAVEAERDGYRACFRCRPELAPGAAPVDAISRLVAAAAARIDAGALNEVSLDALATELGVTARHLRRAFQKELGVAPVELAQSARLALAKQLLHDTRMPLAEIALRAASRACGGSTRSSVRASTWRRPRCDAPRELGRRTAGSWR